MGTVSTPIFGLTAPDDLEPIKVYAAQLRTMTAKIEAALNGRVVLPGVTDMDALAARITALEARPVGAVGTAVRQQVTAGSVSLAADGVWLVPVSGGSPMPSIVLPAAANDWIDLGISYACVNEAGDLRVDFATYNGSTLINYVSGTGATGHGLVGLGSIGGRYETNGGSVPYKVTAADVVGGNVTIKVLMKATGAARSVFANATDPLLIWGRGAR
jgi:hypothetical protein